MGRRILTSSTRVHKSKKPQSQRTGNVVIPIDEINEAALTIREKHKRVTDRQSELVAMLLHDGCTITEAASRIDGDRTWACKVLNMQHVLDYMHELALSVIGAHSLTAVATMGKLLAAKSDHVKLEAAKDLMDRAGLGINPESDRAPPLTINITI